MRSPTLFLRPLHQFKPLHIQQKRSLLTVAIETSCDDTSVAVLEKYKNQSATLHFHQRITSNNQEYKGVHPLYAHESHQKCLSTLVDKALQSLPLEHKPGAGPGLAIKDRNGKWTMRTRPDFVTATRGPGMRASLITGVDTAKGLAVAWQVPFLGVNHMQAHALTPRLISALDSSPPPMFPFLTLLVSGGNTMLVHSRGLCEHGIMAETIDVAVGDFVDKAAREILPGRVVDALVDVAYGPALEKWAFPEGGAGGDCAYGGYVPPSKRSGVRTKEAPVAQQNPTVCPEWTLTPPLSDGNGGKGLHASSFSFSGLGSAIKRIMAANPAMEESERRLLAREAMRVSFEHLGSRVLTALRGKGMDVDTLVVSGGVASNHYLKHILRAMLDSNGYREMKLIFPPPKFCTDNAAMIAWTGIEMWEAGYQTELSAMALRNWNIDPKADDGGILGVSDWKHQPV